ncbi:MAG TPA: F0F1 ATP synthase subunit A [Pirellulales bacterium]|jgi:F-type H+-transporting ATPase subunit a|nr:F0F1 ATP synthase subunit A [Pirellulales bacterium]
MAEADTQHENYLSPERLFGHVQDATYIDLPKFMGGRISLTGEKTEEQFNVEGYHFRLTKFMLIELVVAVLMAVVFIRLANRMRKSDMPKGRWWNMLEGMLVFIRDQVAHPAIGHDAERFLPFLWHAFFFILICNLFGLLPWAGSPTASLSVTGALAISTFVIVLATGMGKFGVLGFWKAQVPHLDLPPLLAVFLIPMIFVIEVVGMFIKHGVLAIRLLANMMAGHLVLAVILAFIAATASSFLFWGVMPVSVFSVVALSLLELLVAFIQAYVFTFLSALFIGMAVHPH